MYVITYKDKPATLGLLRDLEGNKSISENLDTYIAASTKMSAIDTYIYYFGFTWAERVNGVDIKKVK